MSEEREDDVVRGRQPPPGLNWPVMRAKLERAHELLLQSERLYGDTLEMIAECTEDPQFAPMAKLARELQRDAALMAGAYGVAGAHRTPRSIIMSDAADRLVNQMPRAESFDEEQWARWEEERNGTPS